MVEIPNQNILQIKPIRLSQIIWLDNNIASGENTKYKKTLEAEFKEIGFSYADSITGALKLINETVKVVLLVSG